MATNKKKVTYLFGAGASFGTLPLVNDLPKALRKFSVDLAAEGENYEKQNIKDFFVSRGRKKSRSECYKGFSESVKELSIEIEQLASFDTLAKRLTIRQEFNKLREIKAILTAFFLYKQNTSPVSYRHDSFFASILGTSSKLPDNINILSWNYDSQVEIAYSGYIRSQSDVVSTSRAALGMKTPQGNAFGWDGFSFMKLNGSADFGTMNKEEFQVRPYSNKKDEFFDDCVFGYFESTKNNSLSSNIYFAWDSPRHYGFIENVCEKLLDTEILIIVGYSFPYFNKDVDTTIFRCMNNLQQVFIQDPNAELVIETIKSLRAFKTISTFNPILNMNQFYIPNGM